MIGVVIVIFILFGIYFWDAMVLKYAAHCRQQRLHSTTDLLRSYQYLTSTRLALSIGSCTLAVVMVDRIVVKPTTTCKQCIVLYNYL